MDTHAITFIQDLAIIMSIAAIITVLCRLFKQPVVLGYIIAGVIIGPHTPPFSFINNMTTINTIAELGIIFLMFSLGLEFDLQKLKKVGGTALVAAFIEITLMFIIGFIMGKLFGWSDMNSLFLGAILSISSTTIIIKTMDELKIKQQNFTRLIFGILIIEDIFAVAILAFLSSLAVSGAINIYEITLMATKLLSFLLFSLVLGVIFVPKFISFIAKFQSKEMLLICTLGLCFGFCLLVVKLNYSIALGAFMIGAIIGESKQLLTIEELMAPIRDMFSAIFFVSVGLLLDPGIIGHYIWSILIITFVVVLGKIATNTMGVFLAGQSIITSMRVGMGLAQIGEFSFIIASLGISLHMSSGILFPIAVSVCAITTFLTPYLIKYSNFLARYLKNHLPDSLDNYLHSYTNWIMRKKNLHFPAEVRTYVRTSFLYVAINLFFIIGFFLGGNYVATTAWGHLLMAKTTEPLGRTVIWTIVLVLALPFIVAIYRRFRGLAILLVGLSADRSNKIKLNVNAYYVIVELLSIFALLFTLSTIFLFTDHILPPILLFIPATIAVIILGILLSSRLIKFHSKIRIKLLEAINKGQ